MGRSFVTPIGRASFPHLDVPNKYSRYSITLLLDKSAPGVREAISEIYNAMVEEAKAQSADKAAQLVAECQALKDGDNVASFKTYRQEYANNFVLNLSRKSEFGKPCIVNRNKQPINAGEIYAGCDIIAYIDVYGYNWQGKKGVSIGFQHIMKVRDNTPIASTGVSVDRAFDDIDIPDDGPTQQPPVANPFGGGGQIGASTAHKVDPFGGPTSAPNPFGQV